MSRILVIGSLNMDMVIDMRVIPLSGETILGRDITHIPGGKGANQAAAAAKLGGETIMLGCVGNDEFGDRLVNDLSEAGVDTSHIQRDPVENTGTAVIYVSDTGDNSIVVVPGANMKCDIPYLKQHEELFETCDIVILQMEIPEDTIYYAINKAYKLGKTVILNPAPAPEFLPDDIWNKVSYLTPNEYEAVQLVQANEGTTPEEAAYGLHQFGVSKVLVTLGDKGCYLIQEGGGMHYPARKVKAVDTTAAGDCFNGALAVAISEGWNDEKAIGFASAASSIAVTRKGAQSSIPTRAEVDNLLA